MYAVEHLFPELIKNWEQWSKEYRDPRTLGVRAEFVEIHRKTMKLKLAFWDGVDTSDWREPPRKILFELASHCFLAIKDLDDTEDTASDEPGQVLSTPPFRAAPGSLIRHVGSDRWYRVREDGEWSETCGPECDEGHTYVRTCLQDTKIRKPRG